MAMAGTKRRVASNGINATSKKQRTTPPKSKPKVSSPNLEAETDSDPIVESDTTEHSGEDDGVSWPSDEEEEGGVKLSETANEKAAKEAPNDNDLGSKSRESHAKQKVAVQERKAAKPNADLYARSKKIWERLRRQSHVPLQERKKLVAELFDIITGRVKEFVLKHDATRVIQTAIKYGNLEQRKMITKELQGEYVPLAESKYAKFTIGKLLSGGNEDIRNMIVPEFFGNVRRLIKHPEASWILDDIYRGAASKSQKAQLLREWYGTEYALFKSNQDFPDSAELKDILAKNPEKRAPIMRYLFQMIDQLIQKKTTGFTMLHDAMYQYYLNVAPDSEESRDFIELLKGDEEGDLMKNLAFTSSGAQLVSLAIASGAAKDRKQLIKVYKGVIETMAFDVNAKRVLICALDTVDDTVLTSKSIYGELVPKELTENDLDKLLDYATNLNSRGLLLMPFKSKSESLFTKEDIITLKEVHQIRERTSKKEPMIRMKELQRYLSEPLIKFIAAKAGDLVQSPFGCVFIQEVLLAGEGDKGPALGTILSLLDREDLQEVLSTPQAGRMLKGLVLSGLFNPETKTVEPCDPPLGFADMLWSHISDTVLEWATGPNASVVVGLLESKDFSKKDELRKTLNKNLKKLQKAAEQGGSGEGDKKKAKEDKGGNKGTKLLLKVLEQ